MVAHYTAAKKRRSDDAYSAGNKAGKRPDRAVTVYCKKVREIYPDVPIVIGGLEASLRRFANYDYWDDRVRPSILVESGADILIYGMGENQTVEIVNRLRNGEDIKSMTLPLTSFLPGQTPPRPKARPHRRKCSFWNCLRTESVCRVQSWKRQSMSVGFPHAP